jgi:hypothetical protein
MFKLENRTEIASKVFNWKKANSSDVAKKLDTTEEELATLSDDEFLELLFLYPQDACEVS